jgi:hypothetical protein
VEAPATGHAEVLEDVHHHDGLEAHPVGEKHDVHL